MSRARVWLLAVLVVAASIPGARAVACGGCLAPHPSDVRSASTWPALFQATIASTERVRRRPRGMWWRRHVATVGQALRGPTRGQRIVIYRLIADSCPAPELEDGRTYLFFGRPDRTRYPDAVAHPAHDGVYLEPGCNPTVVWDPAHPFVRAFLAALPDASVAAPDGR